MADEMQIMTAPQAQSKLNEVYDFLISFQGMINPNDIRFGRWLKDARALRESRPAEGFLMEALVYRAQGKLVKAVEYAEKSYRLDKSIARNDYATILSDAGRLDEAINLSLTNLQEDCFSDHALSRLIIDSSLTLAKDALSTGLSLFKDPNNNYHDLISLGHDKLINIQEKASVFEQVNVSIENFINVHSIATRAMNSYYLGNSHVSISVQHNEVGKFLIIDQRIFNADIEDCFLIHDKYIDNLTDSELSFKDYKRIVYNFLPSESNELSKDNPFAIEGVIG